MGDTVLVLLTALAGLICGAGLLGLSMMAYMWYRSTAELPDNPPMPTYRPEPEEFDTYVDQQAINALDQMEIPADARAWLDGVGGMVAGQRIKIDRPEILLGRSRVCDVQFHDPKVSRQHAMLRLYNGRYFIQDMQSSRGTMVNKKKIETQALQDGDEIRLGDSVVVFHTPDR